MNNLAPNSLLHLACRLNREKIVEILLRHGADANIKDTGKKRTFTTMHWAAWNGNLSIMKLLIEYQFNYKKLINNRISIKQAPYNLMSVFLILCSNGNVECMKYLYSNFGEIIETKAKDMWGHNGIYLAVVNKNLDMLEYLFTNVYINDGLRNLMINAVSHQASVRVTYIRIYGSIFL